MDGMNHIVNIPATSVENDSLEYSASSGTARQGMPTQDYSTLGIGAQAHGSAVSAPDHQKQGIESHVALQAKATSMIGTSADFFNNFVVEGVDQSGRTSMR